MSTIILKIELLIEDGYETEGEGWEWLKNDILLGCDRLILESEEIGDVVGDVRVLEIVSVQDDDSPAPLIVSEPMNQSSLQLARELIAALTNNGQLSPRLMTPETKALWERWQAEEMK